MFDDAGLGIDGTSRSQGSLDSREFGFREDSQALSDPGTTYIAGFQNVLDLSTGDVETCGDFGEGEHSRVFLSLYYANERLTDNPSFCGLGFNPCKFTAFVMVIEGFRF
jgi:hypothetical protein